MPAYPRRWSTPEEFEAAVNGYFAWAKTNNKPVSKVGMAVHLKMSRMGLWKYGERGKAYAAVMEFADARLEEYLVNRVLTGDAKTIGGPIFILKCTHGYHETQKVEHEGALEIRIKKFAANGNNSSK